MRKIGNTSFREEAIKQMTLKQFKDTYKDILKGQNLESVYSDITGKEAKAKGSANDGKRSVEE